MILLEFSQNGPRWRSWLPFWFDKCSVLWQRRGRNCWTDFTVFDSLVAVSCSRSGVNFVSSW